jgi:phosphoadenosine phosphosulfate reductase
MNALLNVVPQEPLLATARPTAGFAFDGKAYDEDASRDHALEHCNRKFAALKADQRIEWALEHLPGNHVLTSSFGAQAAVSLHLATQISPNIPVLLIDTGYLFPETYRFIDELTERLKINLQVFRADRSPGWQEARHGQRWNQGLEGLDAYNQENKVEPMRRALRELGVSTWFAGLRRNQAETRKQIPYLEWAGGRWKVHPIAEWTDRDVHRYLTKHQLSRHDSLPDAANEAHAHAGKRPIVTGGPQYWEGPRQKARWRRPSGTIPWLVNNFTK